MHCLLSCKIHGVCALSVKNMVCVCVRALCLNIVCVCGLSIPSVNIVCVCSLSLPSVNIVCVRALSP